MDHLKSGQIKFIIHSPPQKNEVSGEVFARKLGKLIKALKAADKIANNKVIHEYTISKLHTSTPTVILNEVSPVQGYYGDVSGIDILQCCFLSLQKGDRREITSYEACTKYIRSLAQGANKDYGYAEVWTDDETIFRIDGLLAEQALSYYMPLLIDQRQNWFKGKVDSSFDGVLTYADFRGSLPELKLTLSAGGKELDCIGREKDISILRASLTERIRVYGTAIYDGRQGLPVRVEIRDVKPIGGETANFERWKGAFEPFESEIWEGDDL